ncbi:MAG: arabinose ABC transporter substrate-binding protein, partial [Armatimonadetes bacterium]|nr:arabinose ABC transporter substrate-binding protein [Armatimonadota bacterium]
MKLLPLFSLAIVFGGCSNNPTGPSTNDPVKIGFLVKSPTEVWFKQEWKFADEAATNLKFELIKLA